ncbi:hypothetical protein HDU93_001552 [Gonapodya sp. JEL0774]|nr:hypothetical protein HDU93_001552 [Gonapodya sp. JEL0774]
MPGKAAQSATTSSRRNLFTALALIGVIALALTLSKRDSLRDVSNTFSLKSTRPESQQNFPMASINTQELQALGQEFSTLRTVHGHWKGGEFNADVDGFQGKKHETMKKLHSMLGTPGTAASLITQAMGKPDDVTPTLPGIHISGTGAAVPTMPGPVMHGSAGPGPGAFGSASGAHFYMIYEWRAKHDYLWFEIDPTTEKVVKSDWYMALEKIAFSSWLNVLLICVPLGIAFKYIGVSDIAVFFVNFAAIVPLAKLLGFATEELALRTNQTIGGLLNASFGNAVELIIGILAVKDSLLRVVQASIIGSILSNLLLVMGFCFFFGGRKYHEQKFNKEIASTSASLLTVTSLAAFFYQLKAESNDDADSKVLNMSRGASIVLLVIYGCYLWFQLKTHSDVFMSVAEADAGEDEEHNQLTMPVSVVLLLISTVFVALCAEALVGSIEGLSKQWGLTESFIGLVLLPIVGNAAEHLTAVTVAMKDKMDLAIGVAIGSSLQIALFVAPLLVLIAWCINIPLNLDFTVFEVAVSFVSVFIVNALITDGKSNWLEGVLLLGAYLVVAIAFYFLP